jgi:hypothetical protein
MITNIAQGGDGERMIMFWCPGCDEAHGCRVQVGTGVRPNAAVWDWNQDRDSPTFRPSLLVHLDGRDGTKKCHLFVTAGKIQYLEDCWHHLKGQTVAIPEWPYGDE